MALATLVTGEGEQPEVEEEGHQETFTMTFIRFQIGTMTVDKSIQVFQNQKTIAQG